MNTFCPLSKLIIYCYKDKCQWWINTAERCAVVVIATKETHKKKDKAYRPPNWPPAPNELFIPNEVVDIDNPPRGD